MQSKSNIITALGFLAALFSTAFIYWQGLSGPFLLDDFLNVVEAHVDSFDLDEIYYAVTHNESGQLGRTVSMLSFVFSGIVHGPLPWGYKFHNLVIHLLNGVLIFWLFYKLLPKIAPQKSENDIRLIAGLTATIWMLHPLMVSTVLYVVQRMAQLSALFTLAALLSYVFAREQSDSRGYRFYFHAYLGFPVFLLLSIFSKESGALIPVYVLAIEFLVYGIGLKDFLKITKMNIFVVVFGLLPVILGSVYLLTHLSSLTNFSLRSFDMGDRLLTQLHVVTMYLKMILVPRLADMTLFHDYVNVVTSFDLVTALLLVMLIILVGLCFYLRKKAPVFVFAVAWFVISHLLESTIFNLEMMFEHRNYLAAVGPLFAVVYYLFSVPEYPKIKYATIPILLLMMLMTAVRTAEWQSEESIYHVAVQEHPDSLRAVVALSTLHYRHGNISEAIGLLRLAQSVNEREYGTYIHEAVYRCGLGDDLDEYLEKAKSIAAVYPATPYSLNAMDNVVAVINSGNCPEIKKESVLELLAAAKQQENISQHIWYTGLIERIEGQIHFLMGNYREGVALSLSAYQKTELIQILARLANYLITLELFDDAEIIIRDIENKNIELSGRETAIIQPLWDNLEQARANQAVQRQSISEQSPVEPVEIED